MNTANKYQPYHGYGRDKLWLSRGVLDYPVRVRTRSDWHYRWRPWRSPTGDVRHFYPQGRRWPFWHRYKENHGSVFEKNLAHRAFRRMAKRAIRCELDGQEVSQNFRYGGDWLD